ncbi:MULTISPECIES: hydroxyisourate hydrolase [Actinomadura]|uniref:Hydroxyisourate hydrolase n=1 Tax=Actinomadura miaoliensis TaxID=430685 RepID=A0ABP7WS55_9ACTN
MSILVSVVDSMHGRPAEGVAVQLGSQIEGEWQEIAKGHTDEEGEFGAPSGELFLARGVHRLELDIDGYYTTLGLAPFYPRVTIDFRVSDPGERHHIPVVITPFACATYRAR